MFNRRKKPSSTDLIAYSTFTSETKQINRSNPVRLDTLPLDIRLNIASFLTNRDIINSNAFYDSLECTRSLWKPVGYFQKSESTAVRVGCCLPSCLVGLPIAIALTPFSLFSDCLREVKRIESNKQEKEDNKQFLKVMGPLGPERQSMS